METYINKLNQARQEFKEIQARLDEMKNTQKVYGNEFFEALDELDVCLNQIEKYSKAIERK